MVPSVLTVGVCLGERKETNMTSGVDDRHRYATKTYLPTVRVEDIVFNNLSNKISAIRDLRNAFPDVQLKEAKEMVETATDILKVRIAKWTGAKAILHVVLLSGKRIGVMVKVLGLESSSDAHITPGEYGQIFRVDLTDLELVRE